MIQDIQKHNHNIEKREILDDRSDSAVVSVGLLLS